MRKTLRVISRIVMVVSGLIALVGVFAFFADPKTAMATNGYIVAVAVSILIGAGILWMLIEISEQIGELPLDLSERKAESVSAASAVESPKPQPRRA